MLKESPLTALTSKFIIPEFTLCLRKSDFIKAEKKKRKKESWFRPLQWHALQGKCLHGASTQKLLSAHFQNTHIRSVQFELSDNLNLLLTKHTKQKMTIRSLKPQELKAKLDSFSTFSTFVSQHVSLAQLQSASAVSCIWKTANCLHLCIYFHFSPHFGDGHLSQIQDVSRNGGQMAVHVLATSSEKHPHFYIKEKPLLALVVTC